MNGYAPFCQPYFGHFWPLVNGFHRLQVGGLAPISPSLSDDDMAQIATLNQADSGFINFGDPNFVKYLIENYG